MNMELREFKSVMVTVFLSRNLLLIFFFDFSACNGKSLMTENVEYLIYLSDEMHNIVGEVFFCVSHYTQMTGS